jgi:hypothetical protein
MARALFKLSAHCRIVFSCSYGKVIHLMVVHCPIHTLKVTQYVRLCSSCKEAKTSVRTSSSWKCTEWEMSMREQKHLAEYHIYVSWVCIIWTVSLLNVDVDCRLVLRSGCLCAPRLYAAGPLCTTLSSFCQLQRHSTPRRRQRPLWARE